MKKRILVVTFIVLLLLISGCGITKHEEGVKLEEVIVMDPDIPQIKLSTIYGDASCDIALYGEDFEIEWGFQDFPWEINLSLVYAGSYEEKISGITSTAFVSPLSQVDEKENPIINYLDGPLTWKGKKLSGEEKLRTKFKAVGGEQTSFFVYISDPYNTQFPDAFDLDKYSPKVYLGSSQEEALNNCYNDFCRIYIAENECPVGKRCSKGEYQVLIDTCNNADYSVQ